MSGAGASQTWQPLLPLAAWLLGAAALAGVLAETLFQDSHMAFAYARLAAYASSLMVGAMLVGALAVFGLSCGAMLWWLDDAQSPGRIFRAVCLSSWPFAAYTWVGVALVLWDRPAALTAEDFGDLERLQARLEAMTAYQWLGGFHYGANGAFLLLAVVLLARAAKPVNAVLGVAFGAAALLAIFSGLGVLAGAVQAAE